MPTENPVPPADSTGVRPQPLRHLLRAFWSTDSYGLVLVMLILTYIVAAAATATVGVTALIFVQIATVWLALRTSLARPPVRWAANVLFVAAAGAAIANLFVDKHSDPHGVVFVAASVLYFVAPIAIVRHISYRRGVDEQTLFGALAAYLFVGMAFAFAYRALGVMQDGPFFGSQGDGTMSDDLFFSFITLTTTGYGNLVPEQNPGQSMAVLEALTGQLFLVTAVAKIISAWRPKRWDAELPPGAPSEPPS